MVPHIPGYGFSDRPQKSGFTFRVCELWARLMTERLGYERFGAHGGDWGSTITEQLAKRHSGSMVAIHLTDVPFGHLFQKPDDPSHTEQKLFKKSDEWLPKEGACAQIQSTKPQSLAPGLNDSPVGQAAWIVEKFRAWSDCGGDVESRFSRDELLTKRDDLLGNAVDRNVLSDLLRLRKCQRDDLDGARSEELCWVVDGTGGIRAVSRRHRTSAA